MAKVDYEKLKEYCSYFLNDFSNDKNLNVKIRADEPLKLTVIATINSKFAKDGTSELEVKFGEDTISLYSSFFDDYYVDEFDNTWEKYSESEILKILDDIKSVFKNYIDNGCQMKAYLGDKLERTITFTAKDKSKIDLQAIYEKEKWEGNVPFDKLTHIDVYDYHYNLIVHYTESRKIH